MPSLVPRLAALVLGLAGSPVTPADFPAVAEVSVGALAVFDEPEEIAYSPGNLRRGERVVVRDSERPGWLTIDPPRGAFNLVERKALGPILPGGRARVKAPSAVVRSGRPGARLPGVPRGELLRGATVHLLDRPPLRIGQGAAERVWVAIAPGAGEVRYVQAEGISWGAEPALPASVMETQAAYRTGGPTEGLPAPVAAEIGQIEALHRAELSAPVAEWRLGNVRRRYEALLKRAPDPDSEQAVRDRLARVAGQEEMAEAARTIETILERSRRRDRQVDLIERRLAAVQRPEARPFESEGMIQPSSRHVKGQKVFALIGPEGTPLAYLDIPPGLDARPFVSRRVGVRGAVHYDEGLRAKLISVRDLEALDDER